MAKVPIVAIVGRANVGKSSLFNRLVNAQQAIVAREAGTTRDAVYGRVTTPKGVFSVVDTAGLKDPADQFEASIQDQITDAASLASVIVVVADATSAISPEDLRVAKLARKSQSAVILALNKAEKGKKIDFDQFKRLGIKNTVRTSATQGLGVNALIELIQSQISPAAEVTDTGGLCIAFVGRPNVGKSSLFNSLSVQTKAVVDDKAGTTRDVNRAQITVNQQPITLLDTAGIRRSGKIERGIERFSVMRAVAAIEEADICILVVDATEPGVALDQKLAGVIKDAGKGLILAVNKWDLIDKDAFTHDAMLAKLKREFQHTPWAFFTVTSAADKQNVTRLVKLGNDIEAERQKTVKTAALNRWLGERVNHHPPAGLKHTHPKLRYMTQTGSAPPQFSIFGTGVRVIHWSYVRYLERELRTGFGFGGTPIRIKFVEKASGKIKP